MNPRLIFLTAILLSPVAHAADPVPEDLLRQGLFEEEANRDFDKAAERYHAVVAAHDRQRALAATATFRLGEIARKKSDKEAAAAAFRTVIERFPEQDDLARLSRENLAALGMAPAAVAVVDPFAEVATPDPEDVEIERLKNLAKNSPDLLDGATGIGWRPLHLAAANGQVKVIAFLLQNKADPNSRTTREDLTPLQLAAVNGQLVAVNVLLAAKAKVDEAVWMKPDIGKELPPMDQRANKGSGQWTALDLAILYDRREVARVLIKAGADLKRTGPVLSDFTPLTSLLEAIYLGRDEIAQALIEAGSPLVASEEPDSPTPLDFAIRENSALAPALLKAGADPKTPSGKYLSTPLQSAAIGGNLEVAKLLIEAGADPTAVNANGQTALHHATTPEMVNLLVSSGADLNAKNIDGFTPLDSMASNGGSRAVRAFEALLAKGPVIEDYQTLLQRTSPDMLAVVRERVAYPKAWRAEAVLLSVADPQQQRSNHSWIAPVEVRPAPGSPPPGIAEGIRLFFPQENNPPTVANLKIVRRNAEGHLQPVFEWAAKQGRNEPLPKDLPALEWGDIVELGLSSFTSGFPSVLSFQEMLSERTVTVRLGGVSFERKLVDAEGFWLGNRDVLIARFAESSARRRVVQPGQQPQQNVSQPRMPRPRVGGDSSSVASSLSLIPHFIDSSKISVTRKGVDQPIQVDLGAKDGRPFRLIDGDVIDLVLKDSVRAEMRQKNKQLLLTTDLKLGGVVQGDGLLSLLANLPRGPSQPELNWSSVKVLREGDAGKTELFNLAKLLPQGSWSQEANLEELAKVNPLQAGDWVLISPLPENADEDDRTTSLEIQGLVGSAAQFLSQRQPGQVRPRVVPPPTPVPSEPSR